MLMNILGCVFIQVQKDENMLQLQCEYAYHYQIIVTIRFFTQPYPGRTSPRGTPEL